MSRLKRVTRFVISAYCVIWIGGCGKSDAAPPTNKTDPRTDVVLPASMPEEMINGKPYRPIQVQYTSVSSSSWKTAKTRVLFNMSRFTPNLSLDSYKSKINRYGSRTDVAPRNATGRFRTEKIDGRWWIIDPEGYLHYYRGTASFKPGPTTVNQNWLRQKFGNEANWTAMASSDLKNMGFIGAGAFSSPYTHILDYNKTFDKTTPIVYAPSFGFLASTRQMAGLTYPDGTTATAIGLVFYPDFDNLVKQYAALALQNYKNDKNLLGIYSDNEIVFSSMSSHILRAFLALTDKSNHAAKAAADYMISKGLQGTLSAFDAQSTQRKEELNDEFAGIAAQKYYKMCRDAIKAVDSQMLYLGSRLHGVPKTLKGVVAAAGAYCDIISINYYGAWAPELTTKVQDWILWSQDKPLMVTEFYAMAKSSGLKNDEGAGFVVWEQRDRAFFYQNFCLGLLECKNFVGWDWFKYQDDENWNKGIFDNNYGKWDELGQYMKDLNINAYSLIDYFDK